MGRIGLARPGLFPELAGTGSSSRPGRDEFLFVAHVSPLGPWCFSSKASFSCKASFRASLLNALLLKGPPFPPRPLSRPPF